MGAIVQVGQHAEAVGDEEEQNQYLTFLLGGEMFAIPILNIKEIIEYGSLTPVPMMPAFIRGVINLRGSVVPVVDLSVRFGREKAALTKRTCIVIIEIESGDEKQDVGVVVDSVSEVLEIPRNEIEQAPSFGAKIRADFIRGMGKINGKFVIILAVNQVLSIDEMAILGQAGSVEPEALVPA
ncbi:MAG: chemotaxis protein CheW [Gallionellales bacterium GWA2_60_18]|nr:MAG: chemotaxis protein CheW [Gallionellales bacterium GWA2_60_18]